MVVLRTGALLLAKVQHKEKYQKYNIQGSVAIGNGMIFTKFIY